MAVKSKKSLYNSQTRYNYDTHGRLTSITYGKKGQTRNVKTANHPSKRSQSKNSSSDAGGVLFLLFLLGGVVSIVQSCTSSINDYFSNDEQSTVSSQQVDSKKANEIELKQPPQDQKSSKSVRGQVF